MAEFPVKPVISWQIDSTAIDAGSTLAVLSTVTVAASSNTSRKYFLIKCTASQPVFLALSTSITATAMTSAMILNFNDTFEIQFVNPWQGPIGVTTGPGNGNGELRIIEW